MNTDASTVEDINIHQIIERLSMSSIESSGKRFSIFRNRSFTLFMNERDFRERSDSATVSDCLLHIPRAQRYVVTFRSGFLQPFRCSRSKHVRIPHAASRDQIHHRFRFCCDSCFTWIFLRSFRHYFRTICRTEMANVKQRQKMIPFITSEVSLGRRVCELVLGVNVFDLDLGVQNWFYQTTNQEQLCGFWKHVSL